MNRCCERLLVGALMVVAAGVAAPAQESIPLATLTRLKQATVYLRVQLDRGPSSGSGFLLGRIGKDGYIVTNSHVVSVTRRPVPRGAEQVLVASTIVAVLNSGAPGERELPAVVVANDPGRDLALLKVTADDLPETIRAGRPAELHETQNVFILGFPFGNFLAMGSKNPAITVSRGSVSSIRRDEFGKLAAVQIDGSINPGNSGGPIVDSEGNLHGIAVAKVRGTQIGLAIPTESLRKMLWGRIKTVTLTRQGFADGCTQIRVTGTLLDPLQKITAVSMAFCPRSAVPGKLAPQADGDWAPLKNQVSTFACTLVKSSFTGLARLPADPQRGGQFYCQLFYVRGDGKTEYLQPVAFDVPADTGAARGVSASQPAAPSPSDEFQVHDPLPPRRPESSSREDPATRDGDRRGAAP
jgi:hypothetical protein